MREHEGKKPKYFAPKKAQWNATTMTLWWFKKCIPMYHTRATISRSWIQAIHKDIIFWKNLLKNKEMFFGNGVKSIQTAAYNGARTVLSSQIEVNHLIQQPIPWTDVDQLGNRNGRKGLAENVLCKGWNMSHFCTRRIE